MHGSTFAGGPLACAVAIAVIDASSKRENLLAHVTEVGDYFQGTTPRSSLQAPRSAIIDVRGKRPHARRRA
jgi:acetylornithine/N-succinyldiaminopimelate aminotransferase